MNDIYIDFEAVLTLGEESGNDYLMFRNELDIAVDNKGNMFILDIGNHQKTSPLKTPNSSTFSIKAAIF